MRIGISTAGGLPGLNPGVKALVGRAANEGHEDVEPCRGWAARLDIDRMARK